MTSIDYDLIEVVVGSAWSQDGAESGTLRGLLEHPDWYIRQWTIEALAGIAGEGAGHLLLSRLADPEALVRISAIERLGRMRCTAAEERLELLLQSDEDALVRVAVAEALGDLALATPEIVRALVRAMAYDADVLVRAYAADALGRLGASAAFDAIASQLTREPSSRARDAE